MTKRKVKLTVRYFPPFKRWYVSADSHTDDYLGGGGIQRFHPTYFPTEEEAQTACDAYLAAHPDEAE